MMASRGARGRSTAGLLLAASLPHLACSSGESWRVAHARPDGFSWPERLEAHREGLPQLGSSRVALAGEAGGFAVQRTSLRVASESERPHVPGEAPTFEGGQLVHEVEAELSHGAWFARARPELVASLGDGHESVPHADPRSIWTGAEPFAPLSRFEGAPRATLGVHVPRHVVTVGNEPFRWGQGVFGGVVAGQAWEGFPHVAVMADRPLVLGTLGGRRASLRYEAVVGYLEGTSDIDDDPLWFGLHTDLRWSFLELSITAAAEAAGEGQDFTNFLADSDKEGAQTNVVEAAGLSVHLPGDLVVGWEYGIDDAHPKDERDWVLDQFHPRSAAWTTTIDWLDVLGDGRLRLALEWFRAESYFYDHGVYHDYGYGDAPLAHQDGGNGESLRLLVQRRLEGDAELDAVLSWWRRGWRNARSGNENDLPGRTSAPGGQRFAELPWDRYGLLLRLGRPIASGRIRWEAGLSQHENRLFELGEDGLELYVGVQLEWIL